MDTPRTGIIIVAGGSGRRMGGPLPKQFHLLDNVPVLVRTIRAFAMALPDAPIVAVLPDDYTDYWQNLSARFDTPKHRVVTGGAERFHSVRAGLEALPDDVELIAIHDGARPLVSTALIRRAVACAAEHGSAIPVVAPADSFRQTDGQTSHIIDRSSLRAVQTPQIFEAALLRRAYTAEYNPAFTDDASVVERSGHPVHLCDGERRNFKITEPDDLIAAEALLAVMDEAEEAPSEPQHSCCHSACRCATTTATDAAECAYEDDPNDPISGGAGAIR